MQNTGISCVIITKDEESRILRCLESLTWVNEIVVVDDESQDRTREVCQEHGARVLIHRSDGNFDGQRNLGIQAAQGPWILQMDADEVVPQGLAQEILQTISQRGSEEGKPVAYRILRRNHFLNRPMRHGGWAGQGGVKLFKKGHARYVGQSVHETLQVEGPIGQLRCPIDHFPFTNFEQFIQRQNFYTSVEARISSFKRGKAPRQMTEIQIAFQSLKLFWKIYVKKLGFLDGMHGFLFSLFYVWVDFLKWAKAWEILDGSKED